ncbi:MAG: nucleotidyl transferase AbiEii/AbiGii toxin family protein [Bacteroidetes bacterium]|nr:nucleotidyl transferase AbiEii/AbiGii toxin family protein [Bacteroidota bacterium]
MIMKGGVLLALGYRSQRYTRDIDFSTPSQLADFDQEQFKGTLDEGLTSAVENLGYGLNCRVQKIEQKPAGAGASFPTIKTTIGYAYKSDSKNHQRLLKGQSIHIIKLDYSLNESVGNIDFFELEDGNIIRVYDTVELISEKFRALLQQEVRNRVRAQDLYDLYYILDVCSLETDTEMKPHILKRLIEKSESRGLAVKMESMGNNAIRNRSREGYKTLPDLVEEELIDFDSVYDQVEQFYRSLPW